ncbi:MAG TPA: ABC transporter substrate-binding protein [Plantibacter sp.]|uniref:ABC transporter substrate-binding protein n=2 Tax=unclassified Plantibacter TaxID=2624265 RepID=UPI002B74A3C1|nr:ABC transporter substrate-binding protein [Plantibacter sp.]
MMFNFRKRIVVAAAAATIVALALSGCSGSGSSSTGPAASGDGTLTIGTIVASTTFAADKAPWANESPYMQAVYDTLLHAEPDGTVVPWLATEWSYNDDNTVLTMKLRDDVQFSDGTMFDADAAAQNLVRFRDGTSPQKAYLATLADAKAVDATTLEITLSAPNPSLLAFLTQNPGLQQAPSSFGSETEQTNPVGSGPYLFDPKTTVVGSTYVFTKNPDYWAPEQQHYAKVVMNVYTTPTAVINAIKGGQINGAPLSDNSTITQAEASGFTANGQQLNFFGLLLFDRAGTNTAALGDVRVRQAINYAFDREAMLKAVGQGYGDVTSSIFSPDSTGYVKDLDEHYAYDPEKAKDLLSEAGYGAGDITLTMPQSSGFTPATYALVQQYLGDVGITVENVNVAPTSFLGDLLAAKYASSVMQLKAAPTSWETMTLDLLPTAGWNPFRTDDPKVAELGTVIQSGSEEDAAKAAQELNEYIVDQAWFAPWYRPQQTYATDATTTVETQTGNAYPYLWNFTPKQ